MSLILRLILWLGLPSWVLPVIGAGLVTLALSFAYIKGYSNASAKCEAASLRVKIESLERDLKAAKDAERIEAEELAKLQKLMDEYEAEIAAYEIELEAKPDEKCVLDDADIRSIDGVRGDRKR